MDLIDLCVVDAALPALGNLKPDLGDLAVFPVRKLDSKANQLLVDTDVNFSLGFRLFIIFGVNWLVDGFSEVIDELVAECVMVVGLSSDLGDSSLGEIDPVVGFFITEKRRNFSKASVEF